MICPNCGKTNPDVAKFCSGCGKEMPAKSSKVVCVRCGAENPDYVVYCGKCGVSMKYDSTSNSSTLKMDHMATTASDRSPQSVVSLQSVPMTPPRSNVATSQEMRINPDELVQELDNLWAAIDAINTRLDALEKRRTL